MSGTDLTTETVELGEGMLGLIGAYGMHGALDIRDVRPKAASESKPSERGRAAADADTSVAVHPRPTG